MKNEECRIYFTSIRMAVFVFVLILHLNFPFTELLLWFCRISPLILQNFSFDYTELPSPQHFHGEPSTSQRRGLGKSMTSPRQLVKSEGALRHIPIRVSENPLKRFSKSPHALQHSSFFILHFSFSYSISFLYFTLVGSSRPRRLSLFSSYSE